MLFVPWSKTLDRLYFTGNLYLGGVDSTMSESENNNSRSAANALISGSEIKGNIFNSTDIEYYSLAATAAGIVSIDLNIRSKF